MKALPVKSTMGPIIGRPSSSSKPVNKAHPLSRPRADGYTQEGYSANHAFYETEARRYQSSTSRLVGETVKLKLTFCHTEPGKVTLSEIPVRSHS